MAKLELKDVVALALKGYKPSDIKELITLAEEAGAGSPAEEQPAGDAKEAPAGEPEETPVTVKEQDPVNPSETIDYKSLYEKTVSDLKKAQAANIAQAAPQEDPEKDWAALQDAVRTYM